MKRIALNMVLLGGFLLTASAQKVVLPSGSAPQNYIALEPQKPVSATLPAPAANPLKPIAPISPILLQDDANDDTWRSKTFSKSFAMDASDKVNISNLYGSITLKIWEKAEVKVDVDIKAYSNSGNEAQKLLDEVSIDANKTAGLVTFKTDMGKTKGSWGTRILNGKSSRKEIKVNYVVYMPANNALTMAQQYGSINMDDFKGALSAKVQYGSFTAGTLSNSNNFIFVQYGKTNIKEINKATVKHQYGGGLSIGTVGSLNLEAQYVSSNINTIKGDATIKQEYGGGLTIGSVNDLNLNAQYSNVNISTVQKNATVKVQYGGGLSIGSIEKLNASMQYAGLRISTLKSDATIKSAYGGVTLSNIGQSCKNLEVEGAYSSMVLGFAPGYDASLNVNTSYSSFRHGDNISAKTEGERQSTTKNYTGKIGNGGGAKVNVNSAYGSVTFK